MPSFNSVARASEDLPECSRCASCLLRQSCLMGWLPASVCQRLEPMQEPVIFPRGTVLFLEGATPHGVHLLCSGLVKTSTTSREGRTLVLRLARPGEALGLSSLMTGLCYPASAEVLRPARIVFLRSSMLLPILSEEKPALLATARWLASELRHAWDHTRLFCFSHAPQVRLAQLLFDRSTVEARDGTPAAFVQLDLNTREIAEMIGTSREAVSRALSDLQRRGILRKRNGGMEILDHNALRDLSLA